MMLHCGNTLLVLSSFVSTPAYSEYTLISTKLAAK
jgi:hypothetical protein